MEVAGSANFALGTGTVGVAVGKYDVADPTKFVAGAVFEGGALKSLDAVVTTAVSLGGLTFTADKLAGSYDPAGQKFTVSGDATATIGSAAVSVKFGGGATPGLVVVGGKVTSADFTVTSNVAVGGLTFKTTSLAASYADATSTYTVRGGASFDLAGSTVGVTFGGKTTAGLVVTKGAVASADFTVDASITVGGLTFTATDLRATYADAAGMYTLKGTAAFTLKDNTVAVTFGDKATAGLVIAKGAVTNADFSVDAKLALGGLTFTADKLTATYAAAGSTYTLKGTAAFVLDGNTVAVTFGGGSTKGLELQTGAVKAFDFTVNSKVVVGGVAVTAKDLRATYTDADAKYTVAGTATAVVTGLGSLTLTLGGGTPAKPGLVIASGALANLDATINSDVTVAGVKLTTTGLALAYAADTGLFTLAGAATATIGGVSTVNLTFGAAGKPGVVIQNGSLVSLDATVGADITVAKVKITATDLRLTYTAATGQYTLAGTATAAVTGIGTVNLTFGFPGKPGLVVQDGSLALLDVTLNSDITVAKVKITTTGLNLSYTGATGQFALAGAATAAVTGLGTLNLTFGAAGKPGLVVADGALATLDLTVNSDITVSKVKITAAGLNLTYTEATKQFTLAGSATATVTGVGPVNLTFGFPGTPAKPGLVVTDGALTSLDATLNSDITVAGVKITAAGLNLSYTAATTQFTLAGDATAVVAGIGTLNLTFGVPAVEAVAGGAAAVPAKPGLVVTDGALTSLDATLNSDITVAGVTVTAKKLNLTYTAATGQFTLAGATDATIKGLGKLDLVFGAAGKPGLVVQNGALVSLDLTVKSDITVAKVKITATDLRLTYTAATTQFALAGTATATIPGIGPVNLTFGSPGKPGLVAADGSLVSLDLTLNSDITVSAVKFTTTGLNLTYTAATSQFTLAGAATAAITGVGPVNLTFGFPGKPGLVITDGALAGLDVTLNSDITVAKVKITTTGLNLSYTAAKDGVPAAFTLAGAATALITGLGPVGLTFGVPGTPAGAGGAVAVPAKPGLVVADGALTNLDATLTSDITVAGVRITTTGLNLTYTAAKDGSGGTFGLAGAATALVTGIGSVKLTFGVPAVPAVEGGAAAVPAVPGLVVTDGSLVSLDLTLNSDITVAGVTIRATNLRLTYTAAASAFGLAGATDAEIKGLGKIGLTFGFQGKPGLVIQNGALVTLDLTLTTDITVAGVTITTPPAAPPATAAGLRLTYTAANSQFTLAGAALAKIDKLGNVNVTFGYQGGPGLVVQDGSLAFLDLTLNSDITVAKVTVTTTGLRLTYTAATNQFTLAGVAQATIQDFGTVGITFGFQGKPGLVVRDGKLVSLAVTLNSDVTVSNVKIVTTGLELSYTAADDKFSLTGATTVTVPQFGTVAVTFGYDNKPGLVVRDGKLVSLDLKVNSNFTFLKYTFTVEDLDLSYTAATAATATTKATPSQFTLRGTASVDIVFGTFKITLGDGKGGQGLIIIDGRVESIDATVQGKVGFSILSIGEVTLTFKYARSTGRIVITGTVDLTVSITLPKPISFVYSGVSKSFGQVGVTISILPGNSAESFVQFRVKVAGTDYGVTIDFNGSVKLKSPADELAERLKAQGADAGVVAVAEFAARPSISTAVNAISEGAKSVGRSVGRGFRRLFGRDNELGGAVLFYDANSNGVLDPGEPSATTEADGSTPQLAPAGGDGQLVLTGGKNRGTDVPNTLVLTAPADATQISPTSTLVQAIRAQQANATTTVALAAAQVALGVPAGVNALNDSVIQAALGGSTNAASGFRADVQLAILAYGVNAVLGGAVADGGAVFAALAARIAVTDGPLDLGDPAFVRKIIEDTAAQIGATPDPAVVAGGAAVIAGVIARTKAIPATDGAAFVRELDQIQKAFYSDARPALAAAAAGTTGIDAAVAAQTGAAFEAELDGETVGDLGAPASNVSTLYAVGAGPGGGPLVRVFDRQTNAAVASFFAFDPAFRGGVTVAVGDVTGDGVPDVVAAAGDGGHARVIVIDGTKLARVGADGQIDPSAVVASFFAFEVGFTGGASVCLAKLDGGSGLSIVVGAGVGGGPRVRTFDFTPGVAGGVTQMPGPIGDFFAFDPASRVGVNVAAGDLDDLGRDDLIIGAGAGGGPVVAIYLPDGTLRDIFFAGDPNSRGGVSVAAGYLDGSSAAQLVTAAGPGGPTVVNVYQGTATTPERSAAVFGPDFTGGATVAVGPDVNGDVRVVVGAGPGGGPRVKVLAADSLQTVNDSFGFDPAFRGGVAVG